MGPRIQRMEYQMLRFDPISPPTRSIPVNPLFAFALRLDSLCHSYHHAEVIRALCCRCPCTAALLLIIAGSRVVFGDDTYHSIGEFHYTLGGQPINPTSGISNSEIDTYTTRAAIAGFQRRNALQAFVFINGTLFGCNAIRQALVDVES